MGQAQRRKTEISMIKQKYTNWLESLSQVERDVALVVKNTHERIVKGKSLFGGCYLLTFFLQRYLKNEKGIQTTAVVGWVNDGTTPLMISHAWLEFEGKKIDITLTHTEHPDVQLTGDLVILDYVVNEGKTKYTYHLKRPPAALLALRELRDKMPWAVNAKEAEHTRMSEISSSEMMIDMYLQHAPSDRNYDALARLL